MHHDMFYCFFLPTMTTIMTKPKPQDYYSIPSISSSKPHFSHFPLAFMKPLTLSSFFLLSLPFSFSLFLIIQTKLSIVCSWNLPVGNWLVHNQFLGCYGRWSLVDLTAFVTFHLGFLWFTFIIINLGYAFSHSNSNN